MTKSTITRERLAKIKSWRETYGAGSNVMLPAEEAEELARMALAAMNSEPVAYMYDGEDGTEYNGHNEFSGGGKGIPLYRHAQPAPVVPDEVTAEDCPAFVEYDVTEVDEAWARGFNSCRAAMLAAATQSPGSEPATVPGKWIPVSEQKPDCWCLTCRPVTLSDMRFVVCPDCGNKRCPRANDHRNACTGSNEPGQEGSVYPAAQQEVKGE